MYLIAIYHVGVKLINLEIIPISLKLQLLITTQQLACNTVL